MIDFSKFNSLFSIASYFSTDDVCKQTIIESRFGKTEQGFQVWLYLLLNFKKNQMIAGNINKNRNMKQTIKLRESELKRMIAETIRSVVNENSFHRGYKAGRNLDVLNTTDGSYRDEDIFSCLAELKSKLKQAEARAKMPQYGNEGEARNYLVAAIRGLQDFINCHY